MKNWLPLICFTLIVNYNYAQHTFSIVAVDPATGEVGSAGATCLDGGIGGVGAAIINQLIPGKGGVCSQAQICIPNINLNNAINQMNNGLSPQEILDWLILNDQCAPNFDPEIRQYGIVDLDDNMNPRSAAFTGGGTLTYANHITGPNYAIQGNILIGPEVLTGMEDGFNNTSGTFADKLMGALQGANIVGADSRCQSRGTSSATAYLRVYQPLDDPADPYLEIILPTVPFGFEPIDSIQTLYDQFLMNMLPFGCTNPDAHNYDPDAVNDDGSCETCDDGIQNGDETEIDCGGQLCIPCCTLEFVENQITPTTCAFDNGAVNVIIQGGFNPIEFSLNNIDFTTDNSFENLAPGDYTVYVKDANNCTFEEMFTIDPSVILVYDFIIENASCNMENGSLNVLVLNGAEPILVSLDNGPFNAEVLFEELPSGNYPIDIRDGNNCEANDEVDILEEDGPEMMINKVDAICNMSTGSITIIASEGTPPYLYALEDLNFISNPTFENLPASSYLVKLKDAAGCVLELEVQINNISTLNANVNASPSRCGENNGSILVNANGGTPPYQYSIDDLNYFENNNFENLAEGDYTVFVMDAAECKLIISNATIDPSEAVNANILPTQVSCNGMDDGLITVETINGTPPFQYSLNEMPFTDSPEFNNLPPNNYLLLIRDSKGCTREYRVLIDQPDSLSLQLTTNNTIILSSIEGGTPPYEYLWSDGSTLDSIANAVDIEYSLTVTDSLGCVTNANIEISPLSQDDLSNTLNIEIFPNPANHYLFIKTAQALNKNLNIEISTINGEIIYADKNDQFFFKRISTKDWLPGVYFLKLKHGEGSQIEKIVIQH